MTTKMNVHVRESTSTVWTRIRDKVRERREADASYRALERELSSYRTPTAVSDLLMAVDRQDSPDAERIRRILARNLADYHRSHRRVA